MAVKSKIMAFIFFFALNLAAFLIHDDSGYLCPVNLPRQVDTNTSTIKLVNLAINKRAIRMFAVILEEMLFF